MLHLFAPATSPAPQHFSSTTRGNQHVASLLLNPRAGHTALTNNNDYNSVWAFVVRGHVDTFLADDGDRVWVSCSNRDGSMSAVAHRQVVMDCEKQTSRNTFEIWPVVSSYMRIRFEHWSAHAKLGHNAVSSTAKFVVKTCLLNTCKAIDTTPEHVGATEWPHPINAA